MVSYDDPESFSKPYTLLTWQTKLTLCPAAKGRYIQQSGLLGFAMWEAAGDYEDLLLDAIEEGMGIGEDACSMSLGLPL